MFKKRTFIIVSFLVFLSIVTVIAISSVMMGRTYGNMQDEFSRKIVSALDKAAEKEEFFRTDSHNTLILSIGDDIYSFPDSIEKLDVKDIHSVTVFKLEKDSVITGLVEDRIPKTDSGTGFNILVFRIFLSQNMKEEGIRGPYSINLTRESVRLPEAVPQTDTLYSESVQINNPVAYTRQIEGLSLPLKCELKIESPNRNFLKQMSGIIISMSAVALILCLSFVYLIYTVFRQKSLEEMRKDFTHNITHELKTPIAAALAVNEALLDFSAGDDPEKRRNYLRMQSKSLGSLSAMVENILSVSVQENEVFTLKPEKCDLRDIVSEQYSNLRMKYGKDICFKAEIPEDAATLYADRFHFSNVIFNIFDNAVKYCTKQPEIILRATKEGKRHRIEIQDNGTGIPPQQRRRIFEKYYRIPTGDVHNASGSGIGLYYSKIIIEKSGGRITAGAASGGGSIFTVIL